MVIGLKGTIMPSDGFVRKSKECQDNTKQKAKWVFTIRHIFLLFNYVEGMLYF